MTVFQPRLWDCFRLNKRHNVEKYNYLLLFQSKIINILPWFSQEEAWRHTLKHTWCKFEMSHKHVLFKYWRYCFFFFYNNVFSIPFWVYTLGCNPYKNKRELFHRKEEILVFIQLIQTWKINWLKCQVNNKSNRRKQINYLNKCNYGYHLINVYVKFIVTYWTVENVVSFFIQNTGW